MPDIIKILPDHVANQIAAGEVVQRPASAVKELLENAVDSGADDIQLIIKDAGKTLIQVVDNGCGMSETDARLCFERHATSKIDQVNDLFTLKTFGFRGEALASIAAIAQVELKTRKQNDSLATFIRIEGSQLLKHEPCNASEGTSISVKNLFFNVPARRSFLKSDATETSYIYEEFYRVALVNCGISFSLFSNGKLIHKLDKSNLRQRINQVYGNSYTEKLIPVDEDTSVAKISGFIGKPEYARKTRPEQYFFVNNRFFKHAYLHHALENAYRELIPENTYPPYFIFLSVDPSTLDVNIHPTKTEVKFQDEKTLYSILKATLRKSFGFYNISPSLDFETERSHDFGDFDKNKAISIPQVKVNTEYNPFEKKNEIKTEKFNYSGFDKNKENWEKLYQIGRELQKNQELQKIEYEESEADTEFPLGHEFLMYGKNYLITPVKSGLMVVNIAHARERINYDRFMQANQQRIVIGQRLMFPVTLNLSPADSELLLEIQNELNYLGIEIEHFGQNSFVVNALPDDAGDLNAEEIIDELLDGYKRNMLDAKISRKENIIRTMARNLASKSIKPLNVMEMQSLTGALFSSSMPETSPSGKKIIFVITTDEIDKKFK